VRPHASRARIKTVTTPTDRPSHPAGDGEMLIGEQGASLEKVRDILFGVQMREYDKKFTRLEERLSRETADLKEDVRKRLGALEQFVKKETEMLADRLKTEHGERQEATKEVSREIRDAAKAFEKKTSQIDDQLAKGLRELRQQLLEQHQRLSEDLAQKTSEVLAKLSSESREIRTEKADRAVLASLLTEMAMRLTDELKLPKVDGRRNG
jgi:hypothetical protein